MAMQANVGKFDTALDEAIYGVSLDGGADEEVGSSTEAPGLWAGMMADGKGIAERIRGDREEFPHVTDEDLAFLETDGAAGVILTESTQGFVRVKYYALERDLDADWRELERELSIDEDDGGYSENARQRRTRTVIVQPDRPLVFLRPPAHQGQVVDVSYADLYDGRVLERTHDKAGRTTSYRVADLHEDNDDAPSGLNSPPKIRGRWQAAELRDFARNPRRKRVEGDGPFSTISEIKAANHALGHHWFEPGALRFFNSRVESPVYGGRYFITSERMELSDPKRYTVRRAEDDGSIDTVGEFQAYAFKEDAADAIDGLLKSGHTPNHARLDAGRIKDALSYVHYWESSERGAERRRAEESVEDAIRIGGLTPDEARVLRNALHLGHRKNSTIAERRRSGVIRGMTRDDMESLTLRIPEFEWKQIGGDVNPGAYGGTIARADGQALELIQIQPVREHVGDTEAADVGFPFWTTEGYYDLADLSLADEDVQSAIESAGLGEYLRDMSPEQRAVAIAEACLEAGHRSDEGTGGWAKDVVGSRMVKWLSDEVADWHYLEDEDDEFRREVLGEGGDEDDEDD